MSNRYDDGAQKKKGMSTTGKVLLIGCGAVGTAVIVMVVWLFVGFQRFLEDNPDLVEAVTEGLQAEFALGTLAPTGRIGSDFGGAVATAVDVMLMEEGASTEPAAEGSGFTFEIHFPDGEPMPVDLTSVLQLMDEIHGGEARIAEILAEGPGTDAGYEPLPDWVPVPDGARRYGGFSATVPELQLGGAVFLADAGVAEIADWYDEAKDDMDGFWAATKVEMEEGLRPQVSVRLLGDGGQIVVLAVEDDHGDSLFAVVYRG